MANSSWIEQFRVMDAKQRNAAYATMRRDRQLALLMLVFAFFALMLGCAQEFHLDPRSRWFLDTQSMFIMSVSAGICAALGTVMWLRMEMHIRFCDLLGTLRK